MKQLIILLICLLNAMGSIASETPNDGRAEWVGFVKSTILNMRSGPGAEYEIVERIPNNAKVDLINENYNASDGEEWIEVSYNGTKGFVSTEYLSIQKNYFKRHHFNNKEYRGLSLFSVPTFMPKNTPLWLWNLSIIAILLTVVFLFLLYKINFLHPFKAALALSLSCCVIYYSISFGEHSLWLLSLTENGGDIGWVFVNGVCLLIFIIVQILLSLSVYAEYEEENMFPSFAPVIIGGGCFLVALIISKFDYESFVWIGIFCVIIGQIIQFAMVWKKTNCITAIAILIVSTATIMLCIPLMYIAAIAIAILIAKCLTGIAVSDGPARHSESPHTIQPEVKTEEKTFLEDIYGKKIEVEFDSSGQNAIEKNSIMPRKFRKKDDGSFEEY